MTQLPANIQTDAFELDGKAETILFQILFPDNSQVFLSPKGEHVWQGDLYEEIPCHMTQVRRQADGEMGRPKFSVANPGGIFTAAVHSGALENALITRIRILTEDLVADLDAALKETFRVSRIVTVTKEMIVTECRTALDGHQFKLPFRTFSPPEFRYVRVR